jgi:homoserine kinase
VTLPGDFISDSASAFGPATIGNMTVGFDVLGGTLSGVGDTVHLKLRPLKSGETSLVTIEGIEGIDGEKLPLEAEKNTAGKAVIAFLKGESLCVELSLTIEKGIPLGSGLGGSAASAVAAVVALNALLKKPVSPTQLLEYALEGEAVASGAKHADNVTPCLLGGLVGVFSVEPLSVRPIPFPAGMSVAVVKPDVGIKTEEARAMLSDTVSKNLVIKQQARLAGFILGCIQNDIELMAQNFKDDWIEPQRKKLIPHFDAVKEAAAGPGVFGASISGAGPAIFALCESETAAQAAALRMKKVYEDAEINVRSWSCEIPHQGAYLLNT